MTWVTLGIGSNLNPQENLSSCLDMLLLHFRDMSISSIFESLAIGYEGNNYLNLVVGFETGLSVQDIIDIIKKIERKHGRDPAQPRLANTPLDIDLLTYGREKGIVCGVALPRGEITLNAFVLWPLSQVAPSHVHPLENKTYKQLWQEYDKDSQQLWPVNFDWHGRRISTVA